MKKLPAVEEAKALLTEAQDWGVFKWLTEKGRVRATADRGTEALNECEKQVKAGWHDDLNKAYEELLAKAALDHNARAQRHYDKVREAAAAVPAPIKQAIAKVKEADDAVTAAREEAERIFDEAERRMSTSMAKEGALKAIEAYDLHEKAIRKAEAAARA